MRGRRRCSPGACAAPRPPARRTGYRSERACTWYPPAWNPPVARTWISGGTAPENDSLLRPGRRTFRITPDLMRHFVPRNDSLVKCRERKIYVSVQIFVVTNATIGRNRDGGHSSCTDHAGLTSPQHNLGKTAARELRPGH